MPRILLSLVVVFVTVLPCATYSQDIKIGNETDSMRGATALTVLVESMKPLKGRISESDIQTLVELKLRQNGIDVKKDDNENWFLPYVYINVNVLELNNHHFVYNAEVSFNRYATFYVPPEKVSKYVRAATWKQSTVGIMPLDSARELRDIVSDLVDGFLNAYLQANPKR